MNVCVLLGYDWLLLAWLRHYHKGTYYGYKRYAYANIWQRCLLQDV